VSLNASKPDENPSGAQGERDEAMKTSSYMNLLRAEPQGYHSTQGFFSTSKHFIQRFLMQAFLNYFSSTHLGT